MLNDYPCEIGFILHATKDRLAAYNSLWWVCKTFHSTNTYNNIKWICNQDLPGMMWSVKHTVFLFWLPCLMCQLTVIEVTWRRLSQGSNMLMVINGQDIVCRNKNVISDMFMYTFYIRSFTPKSPNVCFRCFVLM